MSMSFLVVQMNANQHDSLDDDDEDGDNLASSMVFTKP